MSGQFPDVLLPDVLDNLNLESLLLSAMPVCRYWREQACAHRTYWRDLEFTGCDGYVEVCGPEQCATYEPRHKRSLDLFLLRLSRTYARPVDIAVLYPDPHVLSALAPHLPHVRSLDIVVLVRHWEAAVDLLRRTPAPLLESLSLHYHYQQTRDSDEQFYPVLPRDLFAGQHARLKDVRLYDVDLPSVADLPACFSGITSLVVLNTHQNVQRALPNIFRHCRRLRKLWIYYRARLEDPEFSNDETWRDLDELGLQFIDKWDVLELPLRDIPCVVMAPWTAQAVIEIVSWLGPRLTLAVPPLRSSIERSNDRFFYAVFRVFGDPADRRRFVQMRFPGGMYQPDPPERLALTAFEHTVVSERIVQLALAAQNWDLLVGGRYFCAFPALKRLALWLIPTVADATVTLPLPARAATLSCPQLGRLALGPHPDLGVVRVTMGSADLCAFVRVALPDTPYPIPLELVNVNLSGSLAEMKDACVRGFSFAGDHLARYEHDRADASRRQL